MLIKLRRHRLCSTTTTTTTTRRVALLAQLATTVLFFHSNTFCTCLLFRVDLLLLLHMSSRGQLQLSLIHTHARAHCCQHFIFNYSEQRYRPWRTDPVCLLPLPHVSLYCELSRRVIPSTRLLLRLYSSLPRCHLFLDSSCLFFASRTPVPKIHKIVCISFVLRPK